MKRDRWYGLVLLGVLGVLGGSTPLLAQPVDDSLQPLFDQAAFWQSRQRVDLAEESLKRVLLVDPKNREALYRLGLLAVDNDDPQAAQEWLSQLQRVAPDDARVERLRQAKTRRDIDPEALARARALAKAGNVQGALREYDQLFGSDGPPWDLAAEYYETLAGTDDGWSRASEALADLHQRDPDDKAISLALARVLSYRAESRRSAIGQLSGMTPTAATRAAWRQALLWLDAKKADQGLYEHYLQLYSDDKAVREYFLATTAEPEADPAADARGKGYQALEEGDLSEAQTSFKTALSAAKNGGDAKNGNEAEDAESLAGLGLVALRQQRFAEARDQLGRAIQMAPSHADQWTTAFRSASFYAELAEVRRLAKKSSLDAALARIAPLTQESGRDGRAARLLEADLLHRQGKDDAAEQRYRQVLAEDSRNVEAIQGLVGVLRAQQRWQEAQTLAQQLPAKVRASLGDPRRDQAQALREQANQRLLAGDNAEAHQLLSQAAQLTPDDPWIRLDLARLYQAEGKPYQASFVMAPVLGDDAKPEALQAAALLASEQQRWDDADALLQRIPAQSETAKAVTELKAKVAFQRRLATVQQRLASHDPSARETLYDWYRNPPSSPDAVGSVAMALVDAGQPGMALDLVRRDLAGADVSATPTAYLNHALVLAKAGRFEETRALLTQLSGSASSPSQRAMVNRTTGGVAITQADQLRQQQRYAEAYDVLQPALQTSPEDPQLLLALGRLYSSRKMPEASERVYDQLLETRPDNDEVLAAAVNAALEQGDDQRAERLLVKHAPLSSPSLVVLAARTARAQGDRQQAIRLLEQARDQQLAKRGDAITMAGSAGGGDDTDSTMSKSTMPKSAASEGDSTLREIDRLLTELHRETAPRLLPRATLKLRDGESGLSELTSLGSTTTFSAAPFKRGRLEVSVSPEYVSAGKLSGSANDRYGNNARLTATQQEAVDDQGSITDTGVGLNIAYRLDSVDADIGATPIGFEKSNVVGGITWRPQISENTHLSVTAERRAVKDSVLSYAGVKDPLTGETWGAVTRTGGKVGIEYDDGKSGAYASAGAYAYRGQDVADNHSFDLTTGAYIRPINEPDRQLQIGVNLGYMGFDKNLRYFTYGHGGYFSPQDYMSIAFPVSYLQRQDKWSYQISAAPGFQSYQEDDADVFPEDGDAQSSLDTLAAAGLVGQAHYDGESKSGFGVTLGGDISYQLAPDLSVGGTLGYDTFGDYSETSASVYINYQLGTTP